VKSDPTFWVMARAGGMTAYALLTCSVLLGLVLRSRPLGNRVRPPVVLDVHRFTAVLALSATAVHGLGLLFDRSVHVDLLGLLVPGRITYRPLWTSAGVVAAEMMLALAVSFSLRRLIGVKNWRRLHWASYPVFLAATTHGLLTGSDSNRLWAQWVYLGAIGSVTLATTWRALTARRPAARSAKRRAEPAEATA
jgi:DMSO/TMAO reductase YedYZ heme-binding membrane subunit